MSAVADTKAGWCVNCRGDRHRSCAAPRCECSLGAHPNRPAPSAIERGAKPRAVPAHEATPPPRSKRVGPVDLTIHWEEPPLRDGRGGVKLSLRLADTFDLLRQRPHQWARVVTYRAKSSGSTAAKSLREELGEDFEWKGCKLDEGSALYGRYVGKS